MERFCQLVWRPRPATLLPTEQLKEIKKNIKRYYQRFQLEDKMRESKASKEQIERRQEMMTSFKKWKAACDRLYAEEKPQRLALRNGIDTDEIQNQEENFEEETIEFLVKVEETIIDE